MVLSKCFLEEWCKLIVVLWVHSVASHTGVWVGYTRETAGEESDLLILVKGIVVGFIKSLSHAVVGLISLNL